MPQDTFKLQIEGPDAEDTANRLSELIEKKLGQKPSRTIPEKPKGVVRTDPLAVAAIILAIPSALLAIRDLRDRSPKKETVEVIINFGDKEHKKNPETNITITVPKGSTVKLHMAEADDILKFKFVAGRPIDMILNGILR